MAEPEPLDTELNAKEQAYLNDLLKQDNPVLNKLKSQTSPNDDVTGASLRSFSCICKVPSTRSSGNSTTAESN